MTPSVAARRTPLWLWILLLLGVLAAAWGLWRALAQRSAQEAALSAASTPAPQALQVPATDWYTAALHSLPVQLPVTGTVVAVRSAWVKARVAGELSALEVREGDAVSQGQTLARVDPTEAQARLQQARLQADAAQAQVQIQQRLHDNNRALVARGFISDTALATSAAQLQAAQASHAAARAAQDGAQKYLDDTVLRSPLTGHIARKMAHNGERVMPDAPVVEVVDLSVLELQVPVAANDSAQLQLGQRAQLQLQGLHPGAASATTWPATVVRIGPTAAADSRSVMVYLQLQPVASAVLRPGMYLHGWLELGQTQTVALPLEAVRTDRPSPYVQSVVQGQVQHHTVQLGAQAMVAQQPWVAVQGLTSGLAVLSSRAGALPEGTAVQLLPAPGTPADNQLPASPAP